MPKNLSKACGPNSIAWIYTHKAQDDRVNRASLHKTGSSEPGGCLLPSERGIRAAGFRYVALCALKKAILGSEGLRNILGRPSHLDQVSEPGPTNYTPSFLTKRDIHSVTREKGLTFKLLTDFGLSKIREREKQTSFGQLLREAGQSPERFLV